MLIAYDKKVLSEAKRIASLPGTTQRDMRKFLFDEFITDYGYRYCYLAPEARREIIRIAFSLPRR